MTSATLFAWALWIALGLMLSFMLLAFVTWLVILVWAVREGGSMRWVGTPIIAVIGVMMFLFMAGSLLRVNEHGGWLNLQAWFH